MLRNTKQRQQHFKMKDTYVSQFKKQKKTQSTAFQNEGYLCGYACQMVSQYCTQLYPVDRYKQKLLETNPGRCKYEWRY